MTVYKGKESKTKKIKSVFSFSDKRRVLINFCLIFALVVGFIGNVLLSSHVSAKEHAVGTLRGDFNKIGSVDSLQNDEGSVLLIEELIIYAQEQGMVEARNVKSLVENSGVAFSQ